MMQLLTVYMCSVILVKFNSEEEKKKTGIELKSWSLQAALIRQL